MKNRSIGFYLLLGAGTFSIVSAILYLVLDGGDMGKTFSYLPFILMLCGAVAVVPMIFFKWKFLPLIPTAFWIGGFAYTLRITVPSVSDLWNHVNFIGGNAYLGMVFTGLFLISTILGIVSIFLGADE